MNQPSIATHPSPDVLREFGQGRLAPARQAEIERHVADCDACCQILAALPDDTLMGRIKDDTTSPYLPTDSAPLPIVRPAEPATVPDELQNHPRYRIVRQLGEGGMGVVYQAEHRLMERPVALKVIRHNLLDNPQAIERFRLEVKAAAKLSHANIVTAHDAEQAGELHFLVMEFVDGVSLARQVVKRGPLPVNYACNFMRQAALGLQHAFEKGMVHRDIKPQNLMVTKSGRLKILDFGLARFAREQAEPALADNSSPATDAGLTAAGSTVGTPDYIAPEQITNSRAADIRSDIYSLGCTFYFLLTGQPPFPRGDLVEKLIAHRKHQPKPIRELRPDVPDEVAAIIERMMAKQPSKRFATPTEVAQALAAFGKTLAGTLTSGANAVTSANVPAAGAAAVDTLGPGNSPGRNEVAPFDFDQLVDLANATQPLASPTGPLTFAWPTRRPPTLLARLQPLRKPAIIAAAGALLVALLAVSAVLWSGRLESDPSAQKASSPFAQPSAFPSRETIFGGPNSSTAKSNATATSTNQPLRVLMVIPHRNLYYPDYGKVKWALKKLAPNTQIKVASSLASPAVPAPAQAWEQQITIDVTLANANASDFDAVIFTGAYPTSDLEFLAGGEAVEPARQFINEMLTRNKQVVGICAGIAVLADAGKLRGKSVAFNQYARDAARTGHGGAWDYQRRVIAEDRIITASAADDAELLARELLGLTRN